MSHFRQKRILLLKKNSARKGLLYHQSSCLCQIRSPGLLVLIMGFVFLFFCFFFFFVQESCIHVHIEMATSGIIATDKALFSSEKC